MQRNVPSVFIDVLVNWYSNCVSIVKWNSSLSMCFSQLCDVHQGGVLSPVLFAIYIDDLILKLVKANLGCCIGDLSVCCLVYADGIVLLSGSLHKLQLMLNICNAEINYLDLKFNTSKCHVLHIVVRFVWETRLLILLTPVLYLGTVITAGRTWRTDSSPKRRQCFRAFKSVYCTCASLSELAVQHLVDFLQTCSHVGLQHTSS